MREFSSCRDRPVPVVATALPNRGGRLPHRHGRAWPLVRLPISPFIGRLGSWRSAGSRQRSSAPDIRQF
ncbi:hypothetical protein ACFFX0_29995 [Citricoccus parietis]|uniref:Uncharacterized protein n=1 Tax=Citricoccus parietis TaxID=592307 RepID=A0ABV5G8A1_9MICC